MLVEVEENKRFAPSPEVCLQVGKDCRSCVASTASVTALLCPTLDVLAAQRTFFLLYPQPGCAGAARMFVREYLDAAETETLDAIPPMAASVPYFPVAVCA